MGRAAAINAMPERPSSTARVTPRSAVARARAFNNAERTANPPKRKSRIEREKFVLGHSRSSVRGSRSLRWWSVWATLPTRTLIHNHRSGHAEGVIETPRLAIGQSRSLITRAMTNSSDRRAPPPSRLLAHQSQVRGRPAGGMVRHLIRGGNPLRRAAQPFPPAGHRLPTRVLVRPTGLHLRLCGLDLRVRVPHEPPRPRVRSRRGGRVRGQR